ncbi:amino acid adenylation domain-containing protein [Streptomyces sp. NPDC046261]|uniref:amino acid adenylation domain-containing protein n=1 Tax=Streptomyces sp. NPDC046261 TaxID=3157200 RepID=UPI00340E4A2F
MPSPRVSPATGIVEIARRHAALTPDRPAYAFLPDGETETVRFTFAGIDLRARAVAAALQGRGLAGERVLVAYPSGPQYVQSFLGCLYAGAIAVPCDEPRSGPGAERLAGIRADARPALALAAGGTGLAGLPSLDAADVPDSAADAWTDPGTDPADLAFLQYTSGSTRRPRGVMVDHGNLLANERCIAEACGHDRDSTFVGWVPFFHDMGLVANLLQPLYLGSLSVLMPPMAFLQRPGRWLRAVSRYRAHTSGGPNFAYDLCAERVDAAERAELDLSSWRVAYNGAEPVRADTLRRFADSFAPQGFRAGAHFPSYGLAEATLLVATGPKDRPPPTLTADPAALRAGHVRPAPDGAAGPELVGNGTARPGTELCVVDPATATPCPDGRVGEIWVRGPGVARGYWDRPAESRRLLNARLQSGVGPYLRTGDLGALYDGELFITGRHKDLIVIRGQNHYPHDLERTAEQAAPALRPTCTAAFTVAEGGEERLVLCCELTSYRAPGLPAIAEAVRAAIAARHGVALHALVVLRRGGTAKTTSGKIRRRHCRAAYLDGTLRVHGEIRPAARHADDALPVTTDPELLATALRDSAAARAGLSGDPPALDEPVSALALDSLAALHLHHRIQAAYDVTLPTTALLGDLTYRQLAELTLTAPATGERARPAPADSAGQWLPLTHGQRALWFEQALAPHAAAYHLVRALTLHGPLDETALARAVDRVVGRHPALRTRFALRDGAPVCRTEPDGPRLDVLDATGIPEEEFLDQLAEAGERPFDLLAAGPPVRLTLYRRDGHHVLLLAAHHLVADFWSLVVLLRDLARAHAGADLPPDAPGQSELLAAEREFDETATDRAWAHWSQALADAPPALDLPTDFPRPAVRRFAGATHTFSLPADLTARLTALARQRHTTLFTTLLAGYQVLLHRLTGRRDIVVGSLLARRENPGTADAVGYLVNPLPLRSTHGPGEPFAALLDRTRQTVRAAVEHGGYPFGPLVSRLAPDRTPDRAPLVQSLFVLQREYGEQADGFRSLALGVAGRLRLGGLDLEAVPLPRRWSQLDLSLSMAETADGLTGVWEYRTDLFTEATVAELGRALTAVLRAVTEDPHLPVDAIGLTPAGEPAGAGHTSGPVVPRPALSLHGLAAATARRHPERTAVVAPAPDGTAHHLSHGALHRKATTLAARLRRLGVRPEQPVAVLVERGPYLPLAYLGVLHAGATVLPLDPEDPPRRLAGTIASAGADLVLTDAASADRAEGLGARVLRVRDGIDGTERLSVDVHPEQAAYLLYTSGSTGTPKGVLVPHRAIVNRVLWMQETYRLGPGERVLHKTPVTFDVSMWELLWPPAAGGTSVQARPGGHRDPAYLVRLIDREAVSTAHFVPSVLTPFLTEAARAGTRLPALRRVVCSGEALPARAVSRAAELLDAALHNLYGPTEAAVDVTAWRCHPTEPGPVPIGLPIANTTAEVLDDRLRPLPRPVPGELYLGGACLARGYHGDPALTAARFLPAAGGGRRYRTGDLVRRRTDGALEFRGRTDDQVKIGGVRVEPGEVAEALRALPGVADAAVTPHDGRLAAYVVTREDAAGRHPSPRSLRDALRERLPAALVPAVVLPVERLPVTAAGKLDRRALPRPTAPPAAAGEPPRTATERLLARVWGERLGRPDIGVDQDFFSLGGDSVQAIGVVADCRAAGLPVTVTDLLRLPTVRALAAHLRDSGGPESTAEDMVTEPFALCPQAAGVPGLEDAYPVSMAQRALLFHRDHHPGYEVYVTSVAVSLPLRRALLAEAVDRVADRHPYLRSSFDLVTYPEPTQLVRSGLKLPLEIRDMPPPAGFDAWLRAERIRPFDVATGPLARFTAHDAGAGFRLTLSSFALDGWCVAIVLTEVLTHYWSALRGERHEPRAPLTSYREFVALERAAQRDPAHRAFWRAELAGARPSRLPRRPVPPPGPDGIRQHRHVVPVETTVSEGLSALAAELGVGLKHVLLGVHLRVVRALSGTADVITGLETNGRPERHDGDRMVGVFNNILPLRQRVDGGTWADLARAAHTAEARTGRYRRYPLAQAQRDLGAAALFDTLFVYTHFRLYRELAGRDGMVVSDLRAPDQTYVPLTAHFNVDATDGGGLRLLLESDPRELPAPQAEEIAAYYRRALRAAATTPHRPYRDTPLTDHAGPPAAADVADESVHALFAACARRAPDRIAVRDEAGQTGYGALAHRAARLAATLRNAGAGPETVIGLWARRRTDTVVALLAILHAGAACLPLDPSHPPERHRQVLAEAGGRLLVLPADLDTPLRACGLPVVAPDDLGEPVPPARVHPESLASVMATSGSTGTPKVIGVPHRALVNYLHWAARSYGIDEETESPVHSSLAFDLTVTALLAPLVAGGRVRLVASDDPGALGETLADGHHTLLKITPAHLAALGHQLTRPTHLRTVVVGGEPLHAGHVRALRTVAPGATLVNEYGPTETTVGCCAHRVEGDPGDAPIPVGRPIGGLSACVVEDGVRAPAGVLGELYVGGAGVTRGYLGRPAATAAAYVPDPAGHGARRYRTGDLARHLPDGGLLLAGRADRQVKIRGHRVEPGEVEQALTAHRGVREAAVVARAAPGGGRRLVAYWVPAEPAAPPAAGELTAALAARLPAYAVPAELVRLAALPVTAGGKVDHARLPDPARPATGRARRLAELLDRVEQLSDAEAAAALRHGTARGSVQGCAPGGDDVRA